MLHTRSKVGHVYLLSAPNSLGCDFQHVEQVFVQQVDVRECTSPELIRTVVRYAVIGGWYPGTVLEMVLEDFCKYATEVPSFPPQQDLLQNGVHRLDGLSTESFSERVIMLLAAINGEDRTALFPLADALMEEDDERGKGVAWLAENNKFPVTWGNNFVFWASGPASANQWLDTVIGHTRYGVEWETLTLRKCLKNGGFYDTITDAILDAAMALIKNGRV